MPKSNKNSFRDYLYKLFGFPVAKEGKSEPHLRHNYEDPSLKFLDWVDQLGIDNHALGKIWYVLNRKFNLKRFFFVLIFSFVLAKILFLDFNFNHSFVIGEKATTSVYSPLTFQMTDQIATLKNKFKAENEVPFIYEYDPSSFEKSTNKIYSAFREMRKYLAEHKPPKDPIAEEIFEKEFLINKKIFENILEIHLSDYLFEWLLKNKFSPKLENITIQAVDTWSKLKIAEAPQKYLKAQDHSLTVRNLQKDHSYGPDYALNRDEVLDTSIADHLELISDDLFKGFIKSKNQDYDNGIKITTLTQKDRENLEVFIKLLLKPNLKPQFEETQLRKKAATESVQTSFLTIKKNDLIIKEGDFVKPEQLQILDEVNLLRSEKQKNILAFCAGLLFVFILTVFFNYLKRFSLNKVKISGKDLLVMGFVALTVVLISKIFIYVTDTSFVMKFSSTLNREVYLYLAPVAAGPMLVGLLIQSGEVVWLFSAFLALALGIMVNFNFPFMIVTLAGGIAAARGVFGCKTRNEIYFAGIRTGLINSVVIGLILTLSNYESPAFWNELSVGMVCGLFGGIFSSMVTMVLVPILETIFNYTTDVKLLELSNLNHPLLKEMIMKAPGTYHHSMMVGNMVEAAAEEIAANPLLAKVMAYYHDIGKMEHANYYIENQKPGNNPHDHISPFMSKTLLIAHTKDGVEMGIQHHLGTPIIDGMVQHHGTTVISYFYNKALELKEDGSSEVQEDDFRYPGPKPQFREAALCMLADSIEAAARSLDEPTPIRLQNIVKNIIQRKFMDGQLDECNLTLKDLSKVETAFNKILIGVYHQRIDYPKNAGGGASEAPQNLKKLL